MSRCRNRMRAKKPSHFSAHDTTPSSDVYYVCITTLYIIYVYGMCTYVRNDVYDEYHRDTHRMYRIKNIRDSILRR